MEESEWRNFRHELRGHWNGLRLSVDALRTCTEKQDILDFLESTCSAADEVSQTLSRITEDAEP